MTTRGSHYGLLPSHDDPQRKKIVISLYIPGLFVALLGLIRLLEYALGVDWYAWSIEPREWRGLRGILFAPLLHADWEHFMSNGVALLVLGAVCIFFYRQIAYRVFLWVWLLDGIGVWLMGRDSFHLGASGLVYGLAAFLMFSGLLRKNRSLAAISFFVIAGYGGLVWGMMPVLEEISWEAHLFGFLAGIGLSVFYLKEGPQNDPVPEWYHEEENDDDDNAADDSALPQAPPSIDPLFPRAPDVSPRVTQVPPEDSSDDSSTNPPDDQPRIRINYNYRRSNEKRQ
jgi:membrane associated rhomboid family serine protease